MNEALWNPSAQTLIPYYPDSEHGEPPKQLVKLDHLTLFLSYHTPAHLKRSKALSEDTALLLWSCEGSQDGVRDETLTTSS